MASSKLSILLQKDGLSFLVSKNESKVTAAFLPFESGIALRENLENIYNQNIYLKQAYDSTHLAVLSEKFILVPQAYYHLDSDDEKWLGFNAEITEEDLLIKDVTPSYEIVVISAIEKDFIAFAEGKFNTKKMVHAGHIFLSQFDAQTEKEQVFLNFHPHTFEIAVIKEQKLFLYNIFDFKTKEDILYHLLNVLKQLNIDTHEVELYYYGLTQDKASLKMIMNFIRHVIPASSDLQRMEHLTLIENLQLNL